MSNLKSEQIKSDLNLEISLDQPLSQTEIEKVLFDCLGENECSYIYYGNKKLVCHKNKTIFLTAAVTYLGGNGQHPIFKKRIQLPNWWKTFTQKYNNYDVRFLGVYHYKGNVVFIDFIKDTFIKRKMNNSSAFVYTNDIYQAMKEGVFSRLDVKGNTRFAIRYNQFKKYIIGTKLETKDDRLLNVFKEFNDSFSFNKQIYITEALKALYETNDFGAIRETEWAGWYLENRVKKYISENKLENIIKYIGKSNKSQDKLDFDLWFDECQFYGDLKSSDIDKKEAPGNDKDSFFECINKYDRFWYVIYEHKTEKEKNREASNMRKDYLESIGQWKEPKRHKREYKFHRPIKLSVNFKSMMILELNRVNCHELLSVYNQGVQPDGGKRNQKVKINKRNIENFIIYSYYV